MNQAIGMEVIELGELEGDGRRVVSQYGTVKRDVELAQHVLDVVTIDSNRAPIGW